jgi:truncated hemoglobin YjbI
MRSFWAEAIRADAHYPVSPVSVHLRLEEIDAGLVERWVELFDEACVEVLDQRLAATFRAKAARIAETLTGVLPLEAARIRAESAP